MGLLDILNTDRGVLGMSLLAAAAPQAGPRNTGAGLLSALGNVQQFRDAASKRNADEEEREMRRRQIAMQEQQQMLALQQARDAMAQQQAIQQWRQGIPSPQMQASQQALAGGGGPTQANAQRMPAVDPIQELLHGGMRAGAVPVGDYLSMLRPKEQAPIAVSEGTTLFDLKTKQPIFLNPKQQAPDEFTRALQAAGLDPKSPQAQQLALQRLTKMATHAPGTSVSVNTGQKGLDNTLKLRGDFRSEPVYKAHQEMQSAYSQIQQSLKQASPAGDLAGATKIMKLLDPGSVVRESELGMAMAASGLLDRLENYATNVLKGTKLTPTQRQDFQRLADALYGESVKHYNAKRSEYQGIAERNQLPVEDVLGPASSGPASGDGWSIRAK